MTFIKAKAAVGQGIVTKTLLPTNYRGQRVAAECEALRIVVSWDDELDMEQNHAAACDALRLAMEKRGGYGWTNGAWYGGSMPGREPRMVWAKVGR